MSCDLFCSCASNGFQWAAGGQMAVWLRRPMCKCQQQVDIRRHGWPPQAATLLTMVYLSEGSTGALGQGCNNAHQLLTRCCLLYCAVVLPMSQTKD